tara:strand:- start:7 stop:189 length:183 start_codon:yes stop_codon:yes gene_type:complete
MFAIYETTNKVQVNSKGNSSPAVYLTEDYARRAIVRLRNSRGPFNRSKFEFEVVPVENIG